MKDILRKPPVSHTPEFVAQVIVEAYGNTGVAAKKLKMTPATVRNYIKKYPVCKDAWEEAISDIVGQAEQNLYEFVMERDKQATFFVLKTLAKQKYSEGQVGQTVQQEEPLEFVLKGDTNG